MRMMSCRSTFFRRSMYGYRLYSNTLNSLPRRKSTEQLPNCSGGSEGVMLILPAVM